MVNMGEKMTEEEVNEILDEVELNERGGIDLESFGRILMSRIWFHNYKIQKNYLNGSI